MSERDDGKMEQGLCVARENVERGAGGGMSRENVELQKLVRILVLYDARVLSRCRNLSGTETILSYAKLTFKSARGTVLYWCDTKTC